MLYRSHDNLIPGFEQFVASHNQVTLLTAYLKLKALEEINRSKHITQIVVRWQVSDLCGKTPASELEEIWTYCKTNKIKLYRNTRMHMKVLWSGSNEAIIGSANITRNGLGLFDTANFELAALTSNLGTDDLIYLNRVLLEDSNLVTEDLYHQLVAAKEKAKLNALENPTPVIQELPETSNKSDKFLTNQLPMFGDIKGLYAAIQNPDQIDHIERNCLYHDMALYGLNAAMPELEFYATLRMNFIHHPFIAAFLEEIRQQTPHASSPHRPSMGFTNVTIWFSKNTTEVPCPKRWELKSHTRIIYDWIQYLSEDSYTWDRPNGGSQIIYYEGLVKE